MDNDCPTFYIVLNEWLNERHKDEEKEPLTHKCPYIDSDHRLFHLLQHHVLYDRTPL
jgi:hypothetical protein